MSRHLHSGEVNQTRPGWGRGLTNLRRRKAALAAQLSDGCDDVTDGRLVASLRTGSIGALETLFDRYAPVCWLFARHLARDADGAEAVVEEAFLDLWREPPDPMGTEELRRHLGVLVVRHASVPNA
jgi:hypothetical protein